MLKAGSFDRRVCVYMAGVLAGRKRQVGGYGNHSAKRW